MSATDELRRMLDEREVDYDIPRSCQIDSDTTWHIGEIYYDAFERTDGAIELTAEWAYELTPEQAIAATLDKPKVKKVRGMTYDEHGGEVYFLACSGCGEWIDGDLDCIGEYDGPNFCHNCGGEFDGPLLCRVCGKLADMEFGDMCAECYWHEGEGNDER